MFLGHMLDCLLPVILCVQLETCSGEVHGGLDLLEVFTCCGSEAQLKAWILQPLLWSRGLANFPTLHVN